MIHNTPSNTSRYNNEYQINIDCTSYMHWYPQAPPTAVRACRMFFCLTACLFPQKVRFGQKLQFFAHIWRGLRISGGTYCACVHTFLRTHIPYDLYILHRTIFTQCTYCMFFIGCQLGSLIGCLIGCLLGSLMGCLLGRLIGSLMGCLLGSLMGCLLGSLMGCLYGFQIWPFI